MIIKFFLLVAALVMMALLLPFVLNGCAQQVCPPAQLSSINARYLAAAASACAGTPPSQCAALEPLRAKRLADERDAGCL